jgi:hypothetical protein
MPDPTPQPAKPISAADAAELAAFRAAAEREKLIEAEFVKRNQICGGAIPAAMLREIAARQVDEEAKRAFESK